MGLLEEKVILVTGGTSGIGEACTEYFSRQGASVVAVSIQEKEGESLAAKLKKEGSECSFMYCDVSREEGVSRVVEETLKKYGRIDAVYSNAGVLRTCKITELSVDLFAQVFNVNVLGALLLVKHAIPSMIKKKSGCFCFTTSVASEIGFPEHEVYGASKAAIVSLIRSLTTDYSPMGIRFVGVSPGTIDTPMLAASCASWDKPKEELYADVAKKIPVQRLGKPMDIAKTVAFLMSDDASFINGSVIYLEGGTMALPPW